MSNFANLVHEAPSIYSPEELQLVSHHRVPAHVGIVMDGNRRWAQQNGLTTYLGHCAGAQSLIHIVKAAKEIGIKVLTAFSFSTENWRRPIEEIRGVFEIIEMFLKDQCQDMQENGIALTWIGNVEPFPNSLKETLIRTQKETEKGRYLKLVLALNYGGRDEICRATQMIGHKVRTGEIEPEEVSEELISRYLDTAAFCDLDLLIRTGGEKRLSNFLLWQMYYAEIFFTDIAWPEFDAQALLEAVLDFQKRQRNKGA